MDKLVLKNAHFITSAPEMTLLPEGTVPEFAFLGRSNVGKSSLINYMVGQKRLARISRTPGRTRLLNYFGATLQETPIAFVDLPGFGFAKMSGEERARLSTVVSKYISLRPQIRGMLHLVDVRREPSDEDIVLSRQLQTLGPKYGLVITKADKIVKSKRKAALLSIAKAFDLQPSDVILTSVDEKFGKEEILQRLWNWTNET